MIQTVQFQPLQQKCIPLLIKFIEVNGSDAVSEPSSGSGQNPELWLFVSSATCRPAPRLWSSSWNTSGLWSQRPWRPLQPSAWTSPERSGESLHTLQNLLSEESDLKSEPVWSCRHLKCCECYKHLKNLSNIVKNRAGQVGRHGSAFKELQLLMTPLHETLWGPPRAGSAGPISET